MPKIQNFPLSTWQGCTYSNQHPIQKCLNNKKHKKIWVLKENWVVNQAVWWNLSLTYEYKSPFNKWLIVKLNLVNKIFFWWTVLGFFSWLLFYLSKKEKRKKEKSDALEKTSLIQSDFTFFFLLYFSIEWS